MRSIRWFNVAFLSASCVCGSLYAQSEQLELKKIAEYWKEKDYRIAKMHMREFLEKFPKSAHVDQIYAMLGDLLFQEKNFAEAVECYDKIQDQTLMRKCTAARLHSLYSLTRYEPFLQSAEAYLNGLELKDERDQIVCFEMAEASFYLAQQNRQESTQLLEKALGYYQRLEETPLAERVLLPKARIYALLKKPAQAAALYLTAAHTSNNYEEYLFEAASQQYLFDPKASVKTFERVIDKGGEYAPKAAFNQLLVLFEQKEYKEFVIRQEKVAPLIPEDKKALINFYLGMSQFHLEDFVRAAPLLESSSTLQDVSQSQRKNALIAFGICGMKMEDIALLDRAVSILKTEFTKDLEASHLLLMHAQVCRQLKENTKARESIRAFLSLFPDAPEKELLSYDYALLLLNEENWEQAGSAMQAFLTEFEQSEHRSDALRALVQARVKSAELASFETQKIKQEQLAETLDFALKESIWSEEEKTQLSMLVARTMMSLARYEDAIQMLSTNEDAGSLILLAECALQGRKDEALFASYVEKALQTTPNLPEVLDLRVRLFNTYLGQAEKAEAAEKAQLLAKAADHLFLALEKPISNENAKWLASYYSESGGAVDKAIKVLEHLLNKQTFLPEEETEALKLASLYEKTGEAQKCHTLLASLMQSQNEAPDAGFRYRRLTQFEFANSCVAIKNYDLGMKTYDALIQSSQNANSYFALAAAFEKARLEFSTLKAQEPTILERLCDTFKEIEVQRKLHSEPLHLEAALCYIDAKTAFMEPQEKVEQQRVLLEHLRENFSSLDDPEVVHYLSASSQFPDQERLYQQYMSYVDAQLLSLEEGVDRAGLKQELDKLLSETSEPLLQRRIQKSKEALCEVICN